MNTWHDKEIDMKHCFEIMKRHQDKSPTRTLEMLNSRVENDEVHIVAPEWTAEVIVYFEKKYGADGELYYRKFNREILSGSLQNTSGKKH